MLWSDVVSLYSMLVLIAFSFLSAPFPLPTIWGFIPSNDFNRFHLQCKKREKKVNRSIHPQYQTYINTHIPPIQTHWKKFLFYLKKKSIRTASWVYFALYIFRACNIMRNNLKKHLKNQRSEMLKFNRFPITLAIRLQTNFLEHSFVSYRNERKKKNQQK